MSKQKKCTDCQSNLEQEEIECEKCGKSFR